MRSLVTIEDSTIFSMLNDPAFNTTIPCLFGKQGVFKSPTGGCGSCQKKKQENRRQELSRIKACLAGLGDDKRRLLKQLFDAEKIRIVYGNAAGQVVRITF